MDLGIEQSPMLHPTPPAWAHALPGYGASRVLTDAALTPGLDETGALPIALARTVGPTLTAALLLRSTMSPSRVPRPVADTRRVPAAGTPDTEGDPR
ncbi:hypothetical protein [Streptomyces sp. S.PB5]|uniref:hypothetical protein n=1 Tax=Streptomyces sp. S.PB5 TaxID=3020844 RepID=UPI0025B1A1A2|nr:hypothetical protein [Streptomyces sp. S.PB5]MDN3027854.1 hypothetical protein [Streptomyces sp. S.PB5]